MAVAWARRLCNEYAPVAATATVRVGDDVEESCEFAFDHGHAASHGLAAVGKQAEHRFAANGAQHTAVEGRCGLPVEPAVLQVPLEAGELRIGREERAEWCQGESGTGCQRAGGKGSEQDAGALLLRIAALGEDLVEPVGVPERCQPEVRRQALARVEILAVANLLLHRLGRWIDGRHRVRASRESLGEAQDPAVEQHLLQGGPRVQRRLLDAPRQCVVRGGLAEGL